MADTISSGASAQIIPFSFNTHSVRVIQRDGAPWFVASDVCAALGYINSRKAVADHLDDDEKGVTTGDTLGGVQKLTIISESGLYALVLRSRKPEARKFAKWVTSEVLPAIRKTGSYSAKPLPNVDQALAGANQIAVRVQEAVFKQLLEHGEWAHERWLLSFNFTASGTQPHASLIERDACVLNARGIAKALLDPGGAFSRSEALEIANAVNQRLFVHACNDGPKGVGAQVTKLINRDLPQTDLREIATSATLELWMRSQAETTAASIDRQPA